MTEVKIEVSGGELAYETAGTGPPVLFVHSVIADGRMWDREVPRYSANYQAIRFDLRGFGRSSPASSPFSYTDDVKTLLSRLQARSTYLVGSSMGGAIAIDFALQNPTMVRGLFLAAPGLFGGIQPPFTPDEQTALDFDDKKSQEVAQAWSKGDRPAAFDLLRQLWCSALQGPELELFRAMVEQNALEVFEDRSGRHVKPEPSAGRLSSIRVPTTILVGDRDNPSMEVFAKRIAGSIPGARIVAVHGADHLINLSRPRDFDAALDAALSGHA